jgi:hypothetical protein
MNLTEPTGVPSASIAFYADRFVIEFRPADR